MYLLDELAIRVAFPSFHFPALPSKQRGWWRFPLKTNSSAKCGRNCLIKHVKDYWIFITIFRFRTKKPKSTCSAEEIHWAPNHREVKKKKIDCLWRQEKESSSDLPRSASVLSWWSSSLLKSCFMYLFPRILSQGQYCCSYNKRFLTLSEFLYLKPILFKIHSIESGYLKSSNFFKVVFMPWEISCCAHTENFVMQQISIRVVKPVSWFLGWRCFTGQRNFPLLLALTVGSFSLVIKNTRTTRYVKSEQMSNIFRDLLYLHHQGIMLKSKV